MNVEEYAREKPFYNGHVDIPRLLVANVRKRSGVFFESGAGDGQKLRALIDANHLQGYREVIAADLSSERVSRLSRLVPEARAIQGDAQDPPLPPESVDFIFSDQVIEHVLDDAAMARSIAYVLRPGGLAVVGSVIKGRGAWYFYRVKGQWRLDQTHVREYASMDEFCGIFRKANLSVVDTDTVPVAFPLGDVVARAFAKVGLLSAGRQLEFYDHFPFLKRSRLRIRIPQYSMCYALLERR